jgi:hypothetical protein
MPLTAKPSSADKVQPQHSRFIETARQLGWDEDDSPASSRPTAMPGSRRSMILRAPIQSRSSKSHAGRITARGSSMCAIARSRQSARRRSIGSRPSARSNPRRRPRQWPERLAHRAETAPLLTAFFDWAEKIVVKLSAKSALAGAFRYAINRREALIRFITDASR